MTTAVQVQYRRGSSAQVAAFTGAQGELVIDTTNNRVVVQDGSTAGGFPAAKLSETLTVSGLPGGYLNRFRNGTLDIWQRGTSSLTATTSGNYTADGWIVLPTGASVTVAKAAGRLLTANSLQVTGASSVTDLIIKQRIESMIAAALTSQTVTVQAQVYNNTGGSITPTLTIKHATGASNPDDWSSSTAETNANGVNLQPCANAAWTQIAYTFNMGASAGNGLEVAFDFGNNFSSGSKTVQVAELDIRATPGATAGLCAPPPPELRPITAEFNFCYRYMFQLTANVDNFPYGLGLGLGTTVSSVFIQYPTPMRAAPTFSYTAAGTYQVLIAAGDSLTVTSLSTNFADDHNAQINFSVSSGLAAGDCALIRDGGSANSYIRGSAEL